MSPSVKKRAAGAASAEPIYVHRWKMLGAPRGIAPAPGYQPFVARGVRMYGFVFEGKPGKLADLCARYLNRPAGGRSAYVPAAPLVVLTFTDTHSLAPQNAPFCDMGWAPEREAAFWVPLQTGARTSGVSYAPYMFVDNPIAIIQGREIYGFPKEVGWFEGFPRNGHSPARLAVDVYGVPAFAPQSCAGQYRLLEVKCAAAASPLSATWTELAGAASDLAAAALRLSPTTLFPPAVGMVFLKQFPDVSDGRLAAYQAVVESAATLLQPLPRGGPLPGRYELVLNTLDSHPVADDLGLQRTQSALFAYWLDINFRFESGRVVHPTGARRNG